MVANTKTKVRCPALIGVLPSFAGEDEVRVLWLHARVKTLFVHNHTPSLKSLMASQVSTLVHVPMPSCFSGLGLLPMEPKYATSFWFYREGNTEAENNGFIVF